jgi:hypothetical protein
MACVFSLIMPLPQWIGAGDAMLIFITSIYHLYPPWYFTTIYDKSVGNASLSLENIFTIHSKTTIMFRNPNSNQYYKLIAFVRAGCGRKFTTKEIIISHFLFRIFILNLATFKHHLHMEYIFLSLCYIPEFMVHVMFSVICAYC